MSVHVIEDFKSRSFTVGYTTGTGKRRYYAKCSGESDPITAVVTAVAAEAPFYWNNMSRLEFNADHQGGEIYICDVPYEVGPGGGDGAGTGSTSGNMPDPTQEPGAPGSGPGGSDPSTAPTGPADENERIGPNFSYEIGGKPPKLYRSLETVSSHGIDGDPATDYKGSLNVQPDGKVEGLEIPDPPSVFTMDFKSDSVSWKMIRRLEGMVWHTNADEWYTHDADECVFLGGNIKTDNQGRCDVSFRFGVDQETVIEADSVRTGLPDADVDRPGWHYAWVAFRSEFDATTKRTAERPFELFVERILPSTNFADLGVGE